MPQIVEFDLLTILNTLNRCKGSERILNGKHTSSQKIVMKFMTINFMKQYLEVMGSNININRKLSPTIIGLNVAMMQNYFSLICSFDRIPKLFATFFSMLRITQRYLKCTDAD